MLGCAVVHLYCLPGAGEGWGGGWLVLEFTVESMLLLAGAVAGVGEERELVAMAKEKREAVVVGETRRS